MTNREVCTVDQCGGGPYAYGLCSKHYNRQRKYGNTNGAPPKTCGIYGCDDKFYGRGLCRRHYWRWKRRGTTDLTKPAFLAPPGSKWCNCCKSYLTMDSFGESRNSTSGLATWCRKCTTAAQKRNSVQRADIQLRRRTLKAGGRSEVYSRVDIADRDGWRCQICRNRIGRSFKWPHPRSLSIDHIIPISKGGDDVRANVQAVHLVCNERKNAGGTDQLRLLG